MTETRITVSEALREAADFARDAWRDAWMAMAVVAAGWALIVISGHAQVTDATASLSRAIGWVLLIGYWPLLGALYRLGLGGRLVRNLGPGGMQFGGAEWRILAVNAILGFFFLLACVPMAVISAGLYATLRRLGGVTLGPLGHWSLWFLIAAALCIAWLAWLAYAAGRLSLATPLSVERRRVSPWIGWPLTEGLGRTIAAAFILAHIPSLIVWLGLQAFGWIEPGDTPVGLHGAWPLPETIGAGVVAGLALSAVQAPLSVGLLIFFYDVLAPVEEDARSSGALQTATSDPPLEAESEQEVPSADLEPEPEPPFSTVEFSTHTGRFSRLSAPWLAGEATPDVYRSLKAQDEPEPPTGADEPEDAYPHSIVEYSPHSGRFSRLFAPWLASESQSASPSETASVEPAHEAETRGGAASNSASLDEADKPGHGEP